MCQLIFPVPSFQQPRLISTANFRLARENEAARAAVAAACKRRNCPLEERMEPEVDAACASTNESSMTTKVIARRIDRDCKCTGVHTRFIVFGSGEALLEKLLLLGGAGEAEGFENVLDALLSSIRDFGQMQKDRSVAREDDFPAFRFLS